MDRKTSTDLMRLLHGELSEAAARDLRERLELEPDLKGEYESLQRLWSGLDLPESEPVPPGFATRVIARTKDSTETGLAPAWWTHTWAGKTATALLLAGGIACGAVLASPGETEDWSEYLVFEPSMAESYLWVIEEPDADNGQENGS